MYFCRLSIVRVKGLAGVTHNLSFTVKVFGGTIEHEVIPGHQSTVSGYNFMFGRMLKVCIFSGWIPLVDGDCEEFVLYRKSEEERV